MKTTFSIIEFNILREYVSVLLLQEHICNKMDRILNLKLSSRATFQRLLYELNNGKVHRDDLDVLNTVAMLCPSDMTSNAALCHHRYRTYVSYKIKKILQEMANV